ncbi:TRAP transporter fused permease subunit [uncultured Mailhella sp.]|uniref:TRAP transporter permease n=1 Tax=uncultured Mailhella sp. TaxID=1981031 RepID=UPI0025E5D772|nr:TRAP transporter fused permease subunit [uncultured Mailhella sp.]
MEKLNKNILILVTILAVFMVTYHLAYTQAFFLTPIRHANLHLMLGLTISFLWSMYKKEKPVEKAIAFILAVLSVYATGYIFVEYDELELLRSPIFALNTQDLIVGTLIIGLTVEACRRGFGITFPLVALLFIAYALFGYALPGPLRAPNISYQELINAYVMSFEGGIYGSTLGVSANYIFLFVLFGSFLGATGASSFFNKIGMMAGCKLAGGPAISSVVSSALMGSVTGSAMANVVATGTYTIPLMKRAGYPPYVAGAIEAAASTGGQIMPPVMGVTAFVLAEMAHVPYVEVLQAALLPALLYFLGVGLYVQFQAKRLGLGSNFSMECYSAMELMREAPLFLGPLALIIAMLFMGYSPMFTIFWAILLLVVCGIWNIWRQNRLSSLLEIFIPAIRESAVTGAKIAVTCAVLGPVITTMTKTGLGMRLPGIIAMLSGDSMIVALLITAVVCIILGMGVPTIAAYLMVAMVGLPTLVKLGVEPFSAHMFVFFFAVFSGITPPVAATAIPAAALAESKYMKTAVEAAKIGGVGFFLPFLLVSSPEIMLGQTSSSPWYTLFFFLVGVLMLVLGAGGLSFYLFKPLQRWEAAAAVVGAIGLLWAMFKETTIAYAVSLAYVFVVTAMIYFRKGAGNTEKDLS